MIVAVRDGGRLHPEHRGAGRRQAVVARPSAAGGGRGGRAAHAPAPARRGPTPSSARRAPSWPSSRIERDRGRDRRARLGHARCRCSASARGRHAAARRATPCAARARARLPAHRHGDDVRQRGARSAGRSRESGVPREEIFVTTKLPPSRAGRERETLEASLDALGLDVRRPVADPLAAERRRAARTCGRALLELQAEGLAREVGVSNYSVRQIDELERATGRLPAVNQIEWSPALFDARRARRAPRRGVQLEGYSPLKTMNLRDRRLVRIADAHGVTPGAGRAPLARRAPRSSPSRSRRTPNGSPRTRTSSASSCRRPRSTSSTAAALG